MSEQRVECVCGTVGEVGPEEEVDVVAREVVAEGDKDGLKWVLGDWRRGRRRKG